MKTVNVKEVWDRHMKIKNSIKRFVVERTKREFMNVVSADEVYASWLAWAGSNPENPQLTRNEFNDWLETWGYQVDLLQTRHPDLGCVYIGLSLIADY